MILILVILIALKALFIILAVECKYSIQRLIFVILVVTLTYATIIFRYKHSFIDPIEVYRGNTELQITYDGNTPTDSIVIWKQK